EKESPSGDTSTYNKLNRLLVRVLRSPELLATEGEAAEGTMNVRAELVELGEQISQHTSDSVWTAADMAMLNVLLGRQDAASAYPTFERMKPPDFARQSVLDALVPLAELNLPTAAELGEAVRRLGGHSG